MDSVHCEYEQKSLRPHEKKLVGNSVESPDREAFIIFCLWLVKEARKRVKCSEDLSKNNKQNKTGSEINLNTSLKPGNNIQL